MLDVIAVTYFVSAVLTLIAAFKICFLNSHKVDRIVLLVSSLVLVIALVSDVLITIVGGKAVIK